jgi:hypothetical protein
LTNLDHVAAALAKKQLCIAVRAFPHWLPIVSHPKHFIAHLWSPFAFNSLSPSSAARQQGAVRVLAP